MPKFLTLNSKIALVLRASIMLMLVAAVFSERINDLHQQYVVTESVETGEQLAFLQENCCEHVQEYLFSKPLPAQEFQQYIKDNLD